jgi:hypothetical protein
MIDDDSHVAGKDLVVLAVNFELHFSRREENYISRSIGRDLSQGWIGFTLQLQVTVRCAIVSMKMTLRGAQTRPDRFLLNSK